MNKPRLQIVRGLPGSGKSTLAATRWPGLFRLECDQFFMRSGGYRFTMECNSEAVKWFLTEVENAAQAGFDFVLTGVFAGHTERLGAAVSAALAHGYEIWIHTLPKRWKDVHGVPPEHLRAMEAHFLPENALRERFAHIADVHIGLMPDGYAPVEDA